MNRPLFTGLIGPQGVVVRRNPVPPGASGDTSAYYAKAGPFLTWSQEAAMGGNFTTWQSRMSSDRKDNKLWNDMGANYGYAAALMSARYRGGGTSDWDTDAAAFLTDYAADVSPPFNTSEPHKFSWDFYHSWLRGLDTTNMATWINNLASPVNTGITNGFVRDPTDPSYTTRNQFKYWDAAMMLRAFGNGSYNWVTHTETMRDAFINNQSAGSGVHPGGFPAQSLTFEAAGYSKPFQMGCLVRSAIWYYDQFEQNASVLAGIRACCEHVWRLLVRLNGTVGGLIYAGDTFMYMEHYTSADPDDWRDANAGGQYGSADLVGHWLDPFGWLAVKDGDTTWITRADALMAKANSDAFYNPVTSGGAKTWDENYAVFSWRYSYWKANASHTTNKPVNTVVPTISGTTSSGNTLTANTGTWTNGSSSTWRWMRLMLGTTGGFEQVGTSSTYALTGADVGARMFVEETNTNGNGAGVPAVSAWTAIVT